MYFCCCGIELEDALRVSDILRAISDDAAAPHKHAPAHAGALQARVWLWVMLGMVAEACIEMSIEQILGDLKKKFA